MSVVGDTDLAPGPAASGVPMGMGADATMSGRPPVTSGDWRSETYGSFWIDQTEFALPVEVIQEVVNEPEGYTPVPLSPPHMIGVFYLRGTVVPVVDLRILLGYPPLEDAQRRKVAIIENGTLSLGLLFDDTGGVIYGESANRVTFEADEDGEKDVVVEGMLKLDNGQRMVQLLDPYRILDIEKVPRVAKVGGDTEAKSNLGKRRNCIAFQIGRTFCALDLKHVQEIMDVPKIHDSPFVGGHILGNIDLRGHTVPVIEFRGVLEGNAPFKFTQEQLAQRKLLVLSLPEGQLALLVYSVDSIVSYFERDILPFSRIPIPRQELVQGCLVQDDEEIVILFDYEKLAKDKDLVYAASSCREIFPKEVDEDKTTEKAKKKMRGMRNFIVFSVGNRFALDVEYVSEVINRPETLLTPPFALHYVDGLYNLRGELVPLINPRALYGLDEAGESAKVLIFHSEGKKFGLLVDSVDEMVRASEDSFMPPPTFKDDGAQQTISEDVEGCLNAAKESVGLDPVLILNISALLKRCVKPADGKAERVYSKVADRDCGS